MEIIDDRSCFRTAISFSEKSMSGEWWSGCDELISARSTMRFSIRYLWLRIMSSRLSSSWACTSVRNPRRPRLIPRIGIWRLPMRLAVASRVPSPPRLIAMSPVKSLSNVSKEEMSSSSDLLIWSANSLSKRMVVPRSFRLKNRFLTESINLSLYLLPNTKICIFSLY